MSSDLLHLTCAGVNWWAESQGVQCLRAEVLERIEGLDRLPHAVQLKQAVRRTVYRVELSDGRRMIVKAFRLRLWRDRLKRWVFGSKPHREWSASRRLLAAGVRASHALAVGCPADRRSELEGYLVVLAEPDAVPLNAFLRSLGAASGTGAAEEQLRAVRALARFVRDLHDRGVRHHDLHAGNILAARSTTPPEPAFTVIDLHRIRIGRPPGARHRARAVAHLLRTVRLATALPEQLAEAFLAEYRAAGDPLRSRRRSRRLSPDRIAALMRRQEAQRARSRARRCLKNSSLFAVEKVSGHRVYHRRDYEVSEVLAFVEQHRQTASREAASGRAPAVSRLPSGKGGGQVEVKEFPDRGFIGRLLDWAAWPPGVREYAAAHRARLETGGGPKPLAAVECLRGPDRGRSFTIVEMET
jgi:hypothetical protein